MFSAYSGPILELDRVSFRYPGAGRIIDDLAFAIGGESSSDFWARTVPANPLS